MFALHPSVRLPLYVLGVAAVLVGLALLVIAGGAGAPIALVWRGLVALLIGAAAIALARRARRVDQP
jgi:hypothetical protein